MIRCHALKEGRLDTGEGPDGVHAPGKGEKIWVEVVAPDAAECKILQERLGLHELALEDALKIGHPPKLEEFDGQLFLIVHTPDLDAEEGTRKIAIFLTKDWIVTVLRAPLDRVLPVSERVVRDPRHFLDPPGALAHALLDHLTDGFEEQVEAIDDTVEGLEEESQHDPRPEVMGRLLETRREVSSLMRTVRGQRDVCLALARSGHASVPKKLQPYLRDVYDHLVRVQGRLETVREGLAATRDTYLAVVNNRLSEVMRLLTIIATTLMPLSLVAGIYGMNFERMPGTESPLGFWLTMAAMLALAVGMLVWFRRRGWL